MATQVGQQLKVLAGGKTHKTTRTRTDTIMLTPALVRSWKAGPFQRPLKVNEKVRMLSEIVREDGGIVPGVLTLGVLDGTTFLLDGQHRSHAFLMTELDEGYADVRICHFETMGEMGKEFVNLNSRLVNLKPDDILRGLELDNVNLQSIRAKCPGIGYDMVRRGPKSPIVSMSGFLRAWFGSAPDTPVSSTASAHSLADNMTSDDAEAICGFYGLCLSGFGRDPEYYRLWSALNTTVCAWIYRRTVISQYSASTVRLTKDLFAKCLSSLSADSTYLDWLLGRQLSDRDRSPCYQRIKAIFGKRIECELGRKVRLPQPAWSA